MPSEKKRLYLGSGGGGSVEIPVYEVDPVAKKPGLLHGPSQMERKAVYLGERLNMRLMPRMLVPEFLTYNIFRGYAIALKLHLKCSSENMKCDSGKLPIEILPEQSITRTGPDTL